MLGLVSLDDEKRGLFGLEALIYRQRLKRNRLEKIFLTIDMAKQDILEEAVSGLEKKYLPRHIYAIIADPRSGDILALAQRPTFNPGRRGSTDPYSTRNLVLENNFWPGPMSRPLATYAEPPPGAEGHAYGTESSHGAREFHDRLMHLGAGQSCGILLRPESVYRLPFLEDCNGISIKKCEEGYGFKMTAAQLVRGYCALSDGHLRKLRLFDSIKIHDDSETRKLPVPDSGIAALDEEARRHSMTTFNRKTTASGMEYLLKSASWNLHDPYSERWLEATACILPAVESETVVLLIMEADPHQEDEVMPTETAAEDAIRQISK